MRVLTEPSESYSGAANVTLMFLTGKLRLRERKKLS